MMATKTKRKPESLTPPLKWHGGKSYLASRIIELMPPRCTKPNAPEPDDAGWLHYVEPYAGGLAVLLANDPEGISEAVNDRHLHLTRFWAVLKEPPLFEAFCRAVQATPFSEEEWKKAAANYQVPVESIKNQIDRAADFFVFCRQSRAGTMKGFTPLTRLRTRRGMNAEASAWLSVVDGLPAVHKRLSRVVVFNKDALEVIRQQDDVRTLFYLDPPYLHETRATTGEYAHEMTEEDHRNLLHLLGGLEGRFLLSGYLSGLYESFAQRNGWRRVDIEIPNHAAGGKEKRRMTECVWLNYDPPAKGGAK